MRPVISRTSDTSGCPVGPTLLPRFLTLKFGVTAGKAICNPVRLVQEGSSTSGGYRSVS